MLLNELAVEEDGEEKCRQANIIRCEVDLELFAFYYLPHYCSHPFNEFHYDRFDSYFPGRRKIRRVRAAPRGSAKSTITTLVEPLHDVAYRHEDFVLIVSNTEPQSIAKLGDIRSELLTNELLTRDFKIYFEYKKPGTKKFVVISRGHEICFWAAGWGAEIRGIRHRERRPTKIICDDVEHSTKVYNEEIRADDRNHYFEVISKLGTETTNIEFLGTVLHRESLLKTLLVNPAYEGKLYKSINTWSNREDLWQKWRDFYTDLDCEKRFFAAEQFYDRNKNEMLDGTDVLWPEREPYLFLMKEMIEIGRRAFMKEKQNEPLGAEDKVFDSIHWYTETDGGIKIEKTDIFIPWEDLSEECYGVLDPATGQTKAKKGKLGDYSCLLTGFSDQKGRLLVHRDWTRRAAPSKYITEIFEHHSKYNYCKFGVETNLYRNLLLPNIIAERQRIEKKIKKLLRIPFYDIENTENKEKRIFTLEPKVEHGWILFNKALSATFMNMLIEFPHADHDDGPDALEMLWGLINNRFKATPLSKDIMGAR